MSCVKVNYESQKQSPLADMAAIGPRVLSEMLKGAGDFIHLAGEAAPQFLRPATFRPRKVCEIPETECPPRCVCHVTWEACPGEKRVHHLRVTNSSKKERYFEIKAIPFPDPAGPIQIDPNNLTLGPGKTGEARAIYTVPDEIASGTYKTEILVAGAYEQCITVTLHVGGRQRCECHISQGEIPVRIRAHRWYDHFQCVERCFEPVQQPPEPPPKGRACFLADTPVWVNGTLVQISNVVSGQMVSEPHCGLATDCLEQIETVEEHEGTFECRDIVLESGNHISVVDAHCFMLDSGQWIAAQDLRSSLRLKTLSGTVCIKSVATRATPFVGKVYNLKVIGVDRYSVGEDGVVVRDY